MADLNNLLESLEAEESADIPRSDEDEEEDIRFNLPEVGRQIVVNLPPVQAEVVAAVVGQQDCDMDQETDRDGEYDYDVYGNDSAVNVHRREGDFDDEEQGGGYADAEYVQLKMLWTSELACPELLPHDAENLALHMELLKGQEETIDDLFEHSMNGRGGESSSELSSLAASIYKMEADRVRFILSDLSRTRLAKIENHALHNRELADRMTDEEVNYLQQYGAMLERHLQRTVLNHLPKDAWKKLDEPEMIDSPDLNEFVFCRVLETVEIDNNADERRNEEQQEDDEEDEEYGGVIQEHNTGSCLIARYGSVRNFILEGKIALLM